MPQELLSSRVLLPQVDFQADVATVEALLRVLGPAWSQPGRLTLDFSRCSFISAVGAAVLVALKKRRDRSRCGTEIDWSTLSSGLRRQFVRWRLTDRFDDVMSPRPDSVVPLFHQSLLDAHTLTRYIDVHVVNKMPDMTEGLAKATRSEICELFTNIFHHAESDIGGFVIGQLYPKAKQFQLCICDGGVGLVRRVQRAGFGRGPSHAAIEWALVAGNSTRQGGIPSGLGLHVVQKFVAKNQGKLRIYANDGHYCQDGSSRTGTEMRVSYEGTLVELVLNVQDGAVYGIQRA